MRARALVIILIGMLLAGFTGVIAQDGASVSSAACAPALESLWTAASDACIGKPAGYICNGGSAPIVEPEGPASHALDPLGALVEAAVVDAIRSQLVTAEGSAGGVIWLRSGAPIPFTALLVGAVSLRDVTPPDYPAWQSMVVQTAPEVSACGAAPYNLLILQNAPGQSANIAVNGVSLGLNGTVLVQTTADQTIFAGLSGQSLMFMLGQQQDLRTGEQISVPYSGGQFVSPAGLPAGTQALDTRLTVNLPVALLDRPVIIPQPGYVVTQGAVNLRTIPSTGGPVIIQVPAGQVLSVLGRNTGGDWLHVRLDSGETGWMFAELLLQNIGPIQSVYEATPLPPQRYGQLGRVAKVIAPAGVNLRQAPDVSFGVVGTLPDGVQVNLLARSPYSPWVKVEYSGLTGWLALITLETAAVIDALPIDYDVPPPPPPTRVPGSFGNAFPDPNKPGN